MTRPHREKFDRLLNPGVTGEALECSYAAAPFDRVAREAEAVWGIDRLPGLVVPEMAQRYGSALAKLNVAIASGDGAETAARAGVCIRGMAVMDASARAAGHTPLSPDVWEMDLDGKRIGIYRDGCDWQAVMAAHPGLTIYSLREVVIALRAAADWAATIKASFPGAQVDAIRQPTELEEAIDDFLPF